MAQIHFLIGKYGTNLLLNRKIWLSLQKKKCLIEKYGTKQDYTEAQWVFHEIEVIEYLAALHTFCPLASPNTVHFRKGTVARINQVVDVKPPLSVLQASVESLVSYHCILVDWHSLLF